MTEAQAKRASSGSGAKVGKGDSATTCLQSLLKATVAMAATLVTAPGAVAWAQSTCGVSCSAQTFTSCNDSLNLSTSVMQPVSCAASLGSCSGETFCATLGHELAAASFPVDIIRLTMLLADDQPVTAAEPFRLQVYEEHGQNGPGAPIGTAYDLSIIGSATAVTVLDLTQGGFQPITVTNPGPFRVCLTKNFDAGHNLCLDTDGAAVERRNWAFVSVAANPNNPCGSQLVPPAWYPADGFPFPGIQGDFILRADVRSGNFQTLPGAPGCGGGDPVDAGVVDTGGGGDPLDAGTAPPDAGPTDAGASADAGEDPPPSERATLARGYYPQLGCTQYAPRLHYHRQGLSGRRHHYPWPQPAAGHRAVR